MPVSAEPDPPRTLSLRRRLLAGAAVLAAAVLAAVAAGWLSESRSAASRLQAALDHLVKTDPNWRLNEIEAARAEVPDPENSARLVMEVLRSLPPGWYARLATVLNRGRPHALLLAGEGLAEARADLPGLAPLLSHARRLADLARGRHRITIPDNPYLANAEPHRETRFVSLLLAIDALDLAHRGLMAEAVASCRASLNAGRSLGDEPLFWSMHTRLGACEITYDAVECVLGLGVAGDGELAGLAKLLADEAKHPAQRIYLRARRANLHQAMAGVEQGRFPFDSSLEYRVPEPRLYWRAQLAPWQLRLVVLREHPEVLELTSRVLDAAALPFHEQAKPIEEIEREVTRHQRRGTRLIIPHLLTSLKYPCEDFRRGAALVRSLATVVAAERYRLAKGEWPAGIGDLVPAYLDSVPLDPFDGKPLRYSRHGEGVAVYSVGVDGKDDGGRIDRNWRVRSGIDLGYRLLDVKHRGEPAEKKE
jgi:hypothetical protein